MKNRRKHLDALRAQALLLVQVLLDRAADHLALHGQCIHIAPRLTRLQVMFAARHTQLHELVALLARGFRRCGNWRRSARPVVCSRSSPSCTVTSRRWTPVSDSHVQLDLGRDDPPLAAHGQQPDVGLVVGAFDGRGRDFDLLDQLALVGVHGVEAVDHVVLVGVGGGVAQGAERVHRLQRFLAAAFQAAVDALRLVDDQDRPGRPDQVDGLLAAGLLACPCRGC